MYGNQFGGVNPQYYNPQLENRINQLQNYQYPQNTQFQQQYPQNTQMQIPQQPQTPQNAIRPVTSLEEVRSITPNFDGSKMYFEDVTSGKLYIKYLGMNGLPVTDIFEKSIAPATVETTVNSNEFVSKSEFEELRNKVSQYESIFNELMGGNKVNE